MKVLVANKYFYPKGGAETVFLQEREFLQSAGVDVIDFSMHHDKNFPSSYSDFFVKNRDYKDQEGGALSKVSAAASLIHSGEAVKNIKRLIKQERPDILHCHNIYHQLTPSILRAAKQLGVKVVLTLHDHKIMCPVYLRLRHGQMCDLCLGGNFSNVLKHRCAEGSMAKSALLYAEAQLHKYMRSYESVDRYITVCKFTRDALVSGRFPDKDVSLLYNGVDVDTANYPPHEGKPYILFFGRLSHEKGISTLARAQENTDVRVIVAGTGPLEDNLRQNYPGLELVGFQTGAPLKKLIAQASAVVVPSECYENCPMTVLEAMAASTAVIGSNVGGIPELIEDGKTGLLFDAGDANALRECLVKISQNPDLQEDMGRQGLERLKDNFSFEKHNQGLLKIYDEVMA